MSDGPTQPVMFPRMIFRKMADGVEHKIVPNQEKLDEALLQGWAKSQSGVDEVPGRSVGELIDKNLNVEEVVTRLKKRKR